MKTTQKIECSMILVDLSGFTQLLYQASHNEKTMDLILRSIETMYRKSHQTASRTKDVQIINTTGDGFVAIACGKTPSRTALRFAQIIYRQFEKYVKQIISSATFRQRVDLRLALHHGSVFQVDISEDNSSVFIGDDLNLLSRVIDSQTARRFTYAITGSFYKRLMLVRKTPIPDEVILDRNKYPEEIEIFKLPEKIPEHKLKKD